MTDHKGTGRRGDAGEPELAHAATLGTDDGPALTATAQPVTRVRAATQELAAGTMVGDYRVEGKLGEGGMGQVFAAVHPVIGKRAAIKIIRAEQCANAESVERFVQEARAVNQIGHPNIVDVFAFGSLPDGRPYLMMEWLKGESLAQRLKRGRMSWTECCDVLDAVARALEAAHDQRIIHRDLKPDNVFLAAVKGEQPMVKLLDFGIAKLIGTDDTRVERTATGALLGTPRYISPEQARGRQVDHGADVYSLGAMAFEMFTGRAPFVADNAMDVIAQHLHDEAPAARAVDPSVSPEVDALLAAMLHKDSEQRPSLAEVREVLSEARDRAPRATAVAEPAPANEQRTAAAWKWSLIGLGAAGLAAAAVLALRGEKPAAPSEPAPLPVAARTIDAGALAAAPPDAAAAPVAVVAKPPIAESPVSIVVAGSSRARIEVDGRVVLRSGTKVSLRLPAGDHEVVVTAPGRSAVRRPLEVRAGAREELRIRLERATSRPPTQEPPPARPPDAGVKVVPPKPPPPDDPEGLVDPFGNRTP